MSTTARKATSVVVTLAAALAAWEVVAYVLADVVHDPIAASKVPYLGQIGAAFAQYGGTVLAQGAVTLRYAAIGFAGGCAVGCLLALVMSLSGIVEMLVMPYLLIAQMIPVLGLAPIVFGLFKDIATARMVIAGYITFFPVSVNLLAGLKSADPNLVTLMRANAASRLDLYLKLLVPTSLPHLFSGLKIAAPLSISAAVLVDTLSARDGIGYIIILTLYGGGTTGQFWPALVTTALMGLGGFALFSALEKLTTARLSA